MTIYLDISEVYEIHQGIIEMTTGKAGVRNFALLHSAVERPKATFDGQDLYPTLWAKAAGLLHSICMNHAFTDGNKRTAWGSTKRFLWLNGYHLRAERKAGADFMVRLDNEKPSLADIASWLKTHSTKRSHD